MTDAELELTLLDDLLLRRATEGLDAADETRAARAARRDHPEVDEYRYERAAAAVLLASLPGIEPMPASVKRRLAARWRGPAG